MGLGKAFHPRTPSSTALVDATAYELLTAAMVNQLMGYTDGARRLERLARFREDWSVEVFNHYLVGLAQRQRTSLEDEAAAQETLGRLILVDIPHLP